MSQVAADAAEGFTASVVTDDASLGPLWRLWDDLWRRVPDAWPFTAPAWLQPWWQVFGTGRPVVATLHGPSGLAGLLPLYQLEDKLLPMGVGISDHFDVLLAPEAPADAASALIAAALRASSAPRCDLPELPPDAGLLRAVCPAGWANDVWGGPPCPVLRLQPEPMIPKPMRRDLRQARNRAQRAGGWSVERADTATLPDLFDVLVRLHTQRWQSRGEPGVLADAGVLAFHRTAAPLLLKTGLLRLEAVRLRDRIAAVIYALATSRRIFFYLGGFDPEARFESPGTILLGHMIDMAVREGREEAHFLRGDEAYKYAWGGVARLNAGRSLIRT